MNVGIIGAGIAGLAAGIALARAGHNVTIYEKSRFKNEIGAAILLTPNANRILRRWGFNFDSARPVDFKQFRFVHSDTLEIKGRENFEGVEEKYGDRMCAYQRIDLHGGLRDVAHQEVDGNILLGREVVGIDVENGEAEIKVLAPTDGKDAMVEKVKKDLWIMADGCHTTFLPQITGEDIPTRKVGKSVYRWLAPMSKVLEHPDAKKLWENEGAGFVTFHNERGLMFVTYPCRNGELLNCAVFHDTRPDERDKDDWNAGTKHERVLEVMEGCADVVKHIPMTAQEVKVYTVTQRPPSSTLYRNNFLCIGDTVHHMLPSHAQGGCSALEDAAALEILFSTSTFTFSPSNLQKRLELYQRLRLPRSATTQILSSTNPQITMEGLAKKEEEIRKFYKGELVDWPLGCGPWSEEIREFFYGYDVLAEAEKAEKAEKEQKGLEEAGVTWFGPGRREKK